MISGFKEFSLAMTLATAMAPCASAGRALQPNVPISVEDLLIMEGFGNAIADPSGRGLIFERIRPYSQFEDYSFRTYAQRLSGHQIWRVAGIPGAKPELLPGIPPSPSTYLDAFSPTGRFLTVYQYHQGSFSLSVYDMTNETIRSFDPVPAFYRTGEYRPVWVSESEFVYASLPPGEQPRATSLRTHGTSLLMDAWTASWRGDTVTAQVFQSQDNDAAPAFEPGALIIANAETGEVRHLANGLYADIVPSPDGRWIAALAVSEPRSGSPDEYMQGQQRWYRLTIFDVNSGNVVFSPNQMDFLPLTIAWNPAGDQVTAFGWPTSTNFRHGRFQVVDLNTRTATAFDHVGLDLVAEQERGWFQRPERTFFLGDALAVFARVIPASENQAPRFTFRNSPHIDPSRRDWFLLNADGSSMPLTQELREVSGVAAYADGESFIIPAQGGVYRVDQVGNIERLTPESDGVPNYVFPPAYSIPPSLARPPFRGDLLFDLRTSGDRVIAVIDPMAGDNPANLIRVPDNSARPLVAVNSNGGVAFLSENGLSTSLRIQHGPEDLDVHEVARVNSHLQERSIGTWRTVSYRISDSSTEDQYRDVESCVLLPPNYDAAQPPPMIVEVYPNAGPTCLGRQPRIEYADPESPYLWAGRGYAYARLTTPTSSIRTDEGPIAGMPDAVSSGVEWLIENRMADPNQIVLTGYSQGGISALYTAAHNTHFKAVIAKMSWANLYSHYFGGPGFLSYAFGEGLGRQYAGYDSQIYGDFAIGRSPFQDPEVYYRNSPVFLAPDIDIPVLLIHTDLDAFSMSQFDEMYGALQRAGKSVRYVRYLGEGHAISSPANIRDMWQEIDNFLSEHLDEVP